MDSTVLVDHEWKWKETKKKKQKKYLGLDRKLENNKRIVKHEDDSHISNNRSFQNNPK